MGGNIIISSNCITNRPACEDALILRIDSTTSGNGSDGTVVGNISN